MSLRHVFLSMLSISSAAPLPLQETEPPYVPQPSGRGTIGLLWSCTLTLVLCIWTAIHPDIVTVKSSWQRTLYKAYWTAFSAIFPEFLVCCAIDQFLQARNLHKAWKDAWVGRPEKDWLGMSGAFFVVMGGYVITEGPRNLEEKGIAKENQGDNATPAGGSPITEGSAPLLEQTNAAGTATAQQVVRNLTAAGMKQLLKTQDKLDGGVLKKLINNQTLTKAHFDYDVIKDKSKANDIAKLLVSLQILWVVAQCIGRKAQGLPLTLLEIHILTRMSPQPFTAHFHHLTVHLHFIPEIPFTILAYLCWWYKPLDVAVPIALPILQPECGLPDGFRDVKVESFASSSRELAPLRGAGVCGSNLSVFGQAAFDFFYHCTPTGELWSTIMGLLNGALHATAWISHFPTEIEMWLWRASCIGVGSMPVLTHLLVGSRGLISYPLRAFYRLAARGKCTVGDLMQEIYRAWGEAVEGNFGGKVEGTGGWGKRFPICGRHICIAGCGFVTWVYMNSIMYLAVEAFVSVRNLPQGAYRTVNWANYFPHF